MSREDLPKKAMCLYLVDDCELGPPWCPIRLRQHGQGSFYKALVLGWSIGQIIRQLNGLRFKRFDMAGLFKCPAA